jgi:hypothetical protein
VEKAQHEQHEPDTTEKVNDPVVSQKGHRAWRDLGHGSLVSQFRFFFVLI